MRKLKRCPTISTFLLSCVYFVLKCKFQLLSSCIIILQVLTRKKSDQLYIDRLVLTSTARNSNFRLINRSRNNTETLLITKLSEKLKYNTHFCKRTQSKNFLLFIISFHLYTYEFPTYLIHQALSKRTITTPCHYQSNSHPEKL